MGAYLNGGRPAVYLGVGVQHLRIKYRFGRHTRGFYARWRPQLRRWECQLSGHGMKPRRWFAASQTMAMSELRLIACIWHWNPTHVAGPHALWDNRPDGGYCTPGGEWTLPLFPAEGALL